MPKNNREELQNEIYKLKRFHEESNFSFLPPIETVSISQVIEIIDNYDFALTNEQVDEPETVASVIADFFGAAERLKEVLGMEVEDLEE